MRSRTLTEKEEKERHSHGQQHPRPRSPPPTLAPAGPLWAQLPPPNRTRLLRLLSRMLERQVGEEAAHEPDSGTPGGDHADV